jgi:DNA-directed RNA polymerase subunit RPC12/RpoP
MSDESTPAPTGPPPLSSTCPNCGSQTAYAPGTTALRCTSCGSMLEIAGPDTEINEHSYDEWRARHGSVEVADLGGQVVQCTGCGATTETTDLATACQFCGGALVALDHPEGLVPPEAVVPFHVDKRGAKDAFGEWVKSRWFAPSALKKVGSTEALQGTYVPHWTFDAQTHTDYHGQRGDYYYVTVTDTVSDGKGGTRQVTRQERRTRWRRASGHVSRFFDDVLVVASNRLDPKKLNKMGPWKLTEARPFQQEYITGYSALRYDVDPQKGAAEARQEMRSVIDGDCRRDIGGDEQRVSDMDITYSQAMFKLVLMPLWIATYIFAGKTFQVMVNANTGEVVGDRPWSVAKITMAVLAVLAVVAVIVFLVVSGNSGSGTTGGGGGGPGVGGPGLGSPGGLG